MNYIFKGIYIALIFVTMTFSWGQSSTDDLFSQFLNQSSNESDSQLSAPNNSQNILLENTLSSTVERNPQLALSSGYYPVTAGDIYFLMYAAGTTSVTYLILVDTSYKVRVSNLAVIDAEGKSFAELKAIVETVISKNYPLSGVQFGLKTPAAFRVVVKGEVETTVEQDAWALSRISDVVAPNLTEYSSLRDVSVRSSSGKISNYDLFYAMRSGDLSQDPLVRPGDVVTVNRYSRSVKISGEVERPGTYQLLPNEELKELVEYYGNGYTQVADPSRIELVRYVGSKNSSGEKLFLNETNVSENFSLQDYDEVKVGNIKELLPVMFIEGAVTNLSSELTDEAEMNKIVGPSIVSIGDAASSTPEGSTRLTVRFNFGENYASLVQRYKSAFTAESETQSAYILRKGKEIALNLNPILFDASYRSDYQVEENDVLVIPFRQYFVTVSGAVNLPGRYPYVPDRSWRYYVNLAGGIDPLRNSRQSFMVYNLEDEKLNKMDKILPEAKIEVATNSFLFYFNQYAPVITTLLSIVSTSLSLYIVTGGTF